MTGWSDPSLASYDEIVPALMERFGVPGGAIAVTRNGRLVLARGYGVADRATGEPVQPDALFRIASVSKPITAVAVLKLVEEGRLALDEPAFARLQGLEPAAGATRNPVLARITIRQLLHHTGGWDRGESFDPMFRPLEAAEETGEPAPAPAATVVRYMLSRELDFEPGERYAYSNFGYCVLGRVIEAVTGQSYEAFVRQAVLGPIGCGRMRIGRTLLAGRRPGEVRYHEQPDAEPVEPVFPGVDGPVPRPYGGWHIEAMDAHGGWIASAVDLVRFAVQVDGREPPTDLLQPETIACIPQVPAPPLPQDEPTHYGLGWRIRPKGDEANWWHTGSLAGTRSLLVRTYHGMTWAVLFNGTPSDDAFAGEIDRGMWQAALGVSEWPDHDLFARYGSPGSDAEE